MDVEWWKSLFEIGGVVLLFLTFAFGAGFMLTGKVVNERQAEKLRKYDTDNLALRGQVAALEIQAADSSKGVAGLQKEAADAKTAQQHVEVDLEKQKQKTADAEKGLLELVKLQRPRFIEGHSLSDSLKGKPAGTAIIWYQPGDPEAYWFAFQIMGELSSAGWKISMPVPIPENVSSVTFLGSEFQGPGVADFDRNMPAAVRVAGVTELGLMSKYSKNDPNHPSSLVDILTESLKPLARRSFAWKRAPALPGDTFIIIVGPK
jgi:hypothetical protein